MERKVLRTLRAVIFCIGVICILCIPRVALGEVDQHISAPGIGTGFDETHLAEKARIIRIGNLSEDKFPSDNKFLIPVGCELEFEAVRATADWDTYRHGPDCGVIEDPVPDSLKEGWPRWKCNIGTFLGNNDNKDKGTIITWAAPPGESPMPGVPMKLFEDDVPSPPRPDDIPPSSGVDDGGAEAKYGILQDSVLVCAVELTVALTIRNQDSQETTNTTPYGPDSRGNLGLWNAHLDGKNDMRLCCANHTTGDIYNGSVLYQDPNPRKIGTGLKVEMYASIQETPFTNPFLLKYISKKENWRIWQQLIEKRYVNGVEDTGWVFRPPEWHNDGYLAHNTPNGAYKPEENRADYLYGEDCPYKRGENGLFPTGTVLSWVTEFRTWVEFQYLGSWVRVTPVPAPEGSGDWKNGKPMWGVTWELTWGPYGVSVTAPATLIQY